MRSNNKIHEKASLFFLFLLLKLFDFSDKFGYFIVIIKY